MAHTHPGTDIGTTDNQTGTKELAAILDMSPAGICRVRQRRILWANATLCLMLEYDANDILGRDTRLFYKSDAEYDRVGKALYADGSGFAETRLHSSTGRTIDCQIRASRLDEADPAQGDVIVITDISELKLLQIQLQQAQKMEAIGVLAGGISHDFNNILMAIQGHLSLIQVDVTEAEKVGKHIGHIGKLVKMAADLTGRLLGFARGGKYRLESVDMNALVENCLEKFISTRKEIQVIRDMAPGLKMVNADTPQLKQVLFNLFTNASQAMADRNPVLTIVTQNLTVDDENSYPFKVPSGTYIKITIRDNGAGMTEQIVKKVFDPFFSTRQIDDKKGTGLGLSTVFGIIKNHNGYITVDSEPDQGSAFHIHLPARQDKNGPP